MLGQLSNIEESWDEATNDDEWLQTDATEEKKTLARTVRNSRSWGREALKKIGEFREEVTAWRWHNDSATSRYQEWEEGTNAGDAHIAPGVKTRSVSRNDHVTQLNKEKLKISRRQEA